MKDNVNKFFDYIKSAYSTNAIAEMLDEAIMQYVDYEQMEEEGIDDEFEWYSEFGRGEAEDQVKDELYLFTSNKLGFSLNNDEILQLDQKIEDHYIGFLES